MSSMSSASLPPEIGMFHMSSARRISFSSSVPLRSRSTYWKALNMSVKREFIASDAMPTNAVFFSLARRSAFSSNSDSAYDSS